MKSITAEWVAGFFEGEGCILTMAPSSGIPVPAVTIAQKDTTILFEIQKLFDGSISIHDHTHCSELAWRGRSVTKILVPILPFLIVKKRRAELALRMLECLSTPGVKVSDEYRQERLQAAAEIKRLNHLSIAEMREVNYD